MLLYQPPWFFVASAAAALPCDLVMGTGDWEAHFITPSLGNWATAVKVSRQLSETNDNDPQNSNILQNAKTIQNCHIDGILVVLCISSHAVLKCSEAELPMFKQLRKLRKLSSWCFLWSVESVHYSVDLSIDSYRFWKLPIRHQFKRIQMISTFKVGGCYVAWGQLESCDSDCSAGSMHGMPATCNVIQCDTIQRVNYKLL